MADLDITRGASVVAGILVALPSFDVVYPIFVSL
tara:strand:- start:393 stop:494 length:102 start_codon:yes stop_codon:yes gene_type:complete